MAPLAPLIQDILPTEITYKVFLLLLESHAGGVDYLNDTSWRDDVFASRQWTVEEIPMYHYPEFEDSDDDDDDETQSQSDGSYVERPRRDSGLRLVIRKRVPRLQIPMTMFCRRVRDGKALILLSTSFPKKIHVSNLTSTFNRISSSHANHGLKSRCRSCIERWSSRRALHSLVSVLCSTSILTGGNGCTSYSFVKRGRLLARTSLQ